MEGGVIGSRLLTRGAYLDGRDESRPGADAEQPIIAVCRPPAGVLRGGAVTKLVHYWARDRAFADLGLSPDAGSERS